MKPPGSSEEIGKSYRDSSIRRVWLSTLALFSIGALVVIGSGSGLYGDGNFNYSTTKKGKVFLWIKKKTSRDALIAGHPTFIDGVMLFGMRRGYATTETAHPFYPGYQREISRRLEISLRAHYAKDLQELVDLVDPEGIDYFVFERKRFHPKELKKADYHPPLDVLVKELASRDPSDYAYRKIPSRGDAKRHPFAPFVDNQGLVVNIAALKRYLARQKEGEQGS